MAVVGEAEKSEKGEGIGRVMGSERGREEEEVR